MEFADNSFFIYFFFEVPNIIIIEYWGESRHIFTTSKRHLINLNAGLRDCIDSIVHDNRDILLVRLAHAYRNRTTPHHTI